MPTSWNSFTMVIALIRDLTGNASSSDEEPYSKELYTGHRGNEEMGKSRYQKTDDRDSDSVPAIMTL